MLTSKERAELRARANTLDTTLIVGKEGVTQAVADGKIMPSRYRSYERLYALSAQHKSWENKTV